jgi:hypothetical protein
MPEKNFELEGLSDEVFNETSDSMGDEFGDLEINEQRDEQYVKTGSNVLKEDNSKDKDGKRFPTGKVLGGILVGAGLLSAGGSVVNVERNGNKDLLNEKTPVSSPLSDEYPTKVGEEYSFLSSSIGSGLDEDGFVKEGAIVEVIDAEGTRPEEGGSLQRISDIIDEVNKQDLEERVRSKLTVDAGLVDFLSEEFPEINIPTFNFGVLEGDILSQNTQTKLKVDGMRISELSDRFDFPVAELDEEAIFIRKAEEGWRDEVLTYGGNLTMGFLKEGDVISILKKDTISNQTLEEEGDNLKKDVAGVTLAVVVGKRVMNGEDILTVVFADNEERFIRKIEIGDKEFAEMLGDDIFISRKDWGGIELEKFNFVKHVSESSVNFTPVFEEFTVEAGDLGTRLYSFHNIISPRKDILLTESLIPPGFKFSVKHILFVKYPDGSGVLFGLVKRNEDSLGNFNNSIVLLQYRDPLSRSWTNEHVVEFSHEFRADVRGATRIEDKWYQLENGYKNRQVEFGWNNKGELPFYTYRVPFVEEGGLIMEIFNYSQNFEY